VRLLRILARPEGRAGARSVCSTNLKENRMPRIVNNGGVVNLGGELVMDGCVVGLGATIVVTDVDAGDE
jgi:hypothetical protein